MFAVKHSPFDMVPQVRKRGEDGRKRPAAVMVKQSWHVLEQKIRRPSGFSQAGNFKEESTSCIVKSFSAASERKRLVILNFGITSLIPKKTRIPKSNREPLQHKDFRIKTSG